MTGYVAFVCAMTVGRVTGPVVLDRFGRAPVLWASARPRPRRASLLVILGGHVVVVGLGIVVWGLGASLGFPVGMSAAADDPAPLRARVSVVVHDRLRRLPGRARRCSAGSATGSAPSRRCPR